MHPSSSAGTRSDDGNISAERGGTKTKQAEAGRRKAETERSRMPRDGGGGGGGGGGGTFARPKGCYDKGLSLSGEGRCRSMKRVASARGWIDRR